MIIVLSSGEGGVANGQLTIAKYSHSLREGGRGGEGRREFV